MNQSYYFISLGSNINPAENIIRMAYALLNIASTVSFSRVIKTEPVGVQSNDYFLNGAATLPWFGASNDLKKILNRIETDLGRDRNDPGKKLKSRTADLDILFRLAPEQRTVPTGWLPKESYTRPLVLDLLQYLDIDAPPPENLAAGIALPLPGLHPDFGTQPVTLSRLTKQKNKRS